MTNIKNTAVFSPEIYPSSHMMNTMKTWTLLNHIMTST